MIPHNIRELGASQALRLAYAWAAMVKENKSQLAQSMGGFWPLVRWSIWPMKEITQRLKATKI